MQGPTDKLLKVLFMFCLCAGKCNKMATCPFIHDPDKVAVCTKYVCLLHLLSHACRHFLSYRPDSRFLRGMCDKTDGTCLFSHKISKEKVHNENVLSGGICTCIGDS